MKRTLGPALKILAFKIPLAFALPALAVPALLFAGSMRAADAPVVVTSIKPIHSLVAAIMQGVGEPELIVDGAASPHTYSLKLRDRTRCRPRRRSGIAACCRGAGPLVGQW